MSYSLSIVTPPISQNDDEAWKQLDVLSCEELGLSPDGRSFTINRRQSKPTPPPEFRQLYELLVERYPCLCSLPAAREHETIWSDGPLWGNFGTRVATLGIQGERADEALPFIVESANSLGLILFEPAAGNIFRPDFR